MYICIYVYMYICIYVYMYICMCIHMYTQTSVTKNTYDYTDHACMHIEGVYTQTWPPSGSVRGFLPLPNFTDGFQSKLPFSWSQS